MKHGQTILLLIAVIMWLLAALKTSEPKQWSWGWGGLFFFGLSLLWPFLLTL